MELTLTLFLKLVEWLSKQEASQLAIKLNDWQKTIGLVIKRLF